ncbi:MAG: hypothetical protein H7Z13_14590 [Ferruginibacter sp.]|nr:hypothetical protein [Ferruginibacter sp.]
MKLRFLLLVFVLLSFLAAGAQPKLSFDGYYATLPDSSNPFRYYLRFYPDGAVIGYSTAGNPNNLIPWFKKDHKAPSKGNYVLKDSTISFSLQAEEGKILYEGSVYPGNRLFFTVKSLINKYEGKEEYFFMKMEGLK